MDRKKIRKVTQMKNLIYMGDSPPDEEFSKMLDFESSLRRSVKERIKLGFWKIKRPVLDDKSRAFNTMEEYRKWCEENLPKWMGYERTK